MIRHEGRRSGLSRRGLLFGSTTGDMPFGLDTSARIGPACLSLHAVACRACEDACAARAIRFRPKSGGHFHPVVLADLCTACGDCLPHCPVAAISLSQAARHD